MPMFENASYINASGQFNEVHGNQTIVTPPAPALESARTLQTPPESLIGRTLRWIFGTPKLPSVTVRCVRIPANGSNPRLVDLPTTYIGNENSVDSCLYHIPDFRPYWGTGDAWQNRDLQGQHLDSAQFRGLYYLFYSGGIDDLPVNKSFPSRTIWGDAFVVKVADYEFDSDGLAVYEDVPDEFATSRELALLIKTGWHN